MKGGDSMKYTAKWIEDHLGISSDTIVITKRSIYGNALAIPKTNIVSILKIILSACGLSNSSVGSVIP